MANQENTGSFKLNIGGPSIILLLTVLGLSVFAVLSIRASYNGLKMSRTTAEAVGMYYEAEALAEEVEYNIRECVVANGYAYFGAESMISKTVEEALLKLEYVTEAGNGKVAYEIPLRKGLVLHVELTGTEEYERLQVSDHRMIAEKLEGYSGSGFEVNVIEIQ